MTVTRDSLGVGLYSPEEAAFYARVSTRLLNRWLFDVHGDSVVTPQISPQDPRDRVVTFLDLVQALAIRHIRMNFKIRLDKIRRAVEYVQKKFDIAYPFATDHTTYLVSDGKRQGHGEIFIRVKKVEDEDEMFVQASGRAKGNILLKPVVEMYMDNLKYDLASGFASEYRPLSLNDENILLCPHRRLGEPVLEKCGHTAQTLWEAVIAEGGIAAAAKAYGVPETAVRLAYQYYDYLKNSAV